MTATINRKTRKGEPETWTDGSSQTRQNPRVEGYGYGFSPPRYSGSGFWTGLELNRTIFPVQTRTAGGLPGPVANTTPDAETWLQSRLHLRPAPNPPQLVTLPEVNLLTSSMCWLDIHIRIQLYPVRNFTMMMTIPSTIPISIDICWVMKVSTISVVW